MTNPIRQNLVGYLVGALDEQERSEVEDALAGDLRLRHELNLLERSLSPLATDRGHYDPPPLLASRACQYVYQRTELMPAALSSVGRGEAAPYRVWSFADVAVAAGIFLAASLLFWPAINSSRASAQLAACQNNIRLIGNALFAYSEWDKQGMFPTVPTQGNLAAGGMFGPTLLDGEFLKDEQALFCPSDGRFARSAMFSIPRMEEIMAAHGERLRDMQGRMGGSYAYTLGYVTEDGGYRGLRNLRRPTFPLLADAPIKECTGRDNHGLRGQNVLFEDGRVDYVKECQLHHTGDHIYMNSKNEVGPGLHRDDAVITNQVLDGAINGLRGVKGIDPLEVNPVLQRALDR